MPSFAGLCGGRTGRILRLRRQLVHQPLPSLRSDDAIDFDRQVRLERAHGFLCVRTVLAVHLARIVSELREGVLNARKLVQIDVTELFGVVLELRHTDSPASCRGVTCSTSTRASRRLCRPLRHRLPPHLALCPNPASCRSKALRYWSLLHRDASRAR